MKMNMNSLKKLFTRENLPELILGGISALYILGDIKPPQDLAGLVDTPMGTIVLIMAVILVCSKSHPIVSILFLVAAYELYKRSKDHYIRGTQDKLPKDKHRPHLTPEVQFPVTLEEQVVKKMAPWVLTTSTTPASYKPVMDSDLNAANL
jgi:hypothetical protein